MELKIFFDSLDEELFKDIKDLTSFYQNINAYHGKLPDWKNADIALIGLSENRGSQNNKGVEFAANAVRKELYRLKKGKGAYKIVDLGNMRCGHKLEETYLRIKEVGEILLTFGVMPVFFGGSHDLDLGLYLSYEKFEKLINVVTVDSVLDLDGSDERGANRHHTHRIMVHEPNYLFNYANLGHQIYLNDTDTVGVLEKLHFEGYRVGQIRDNLMEMEPVVRNADMLSFDVSAIKINDAPGNENAFPFGLSGEEACQLCWFAGLSDKLSGAGFYEFNPEPDQGGKTAKVMATMIWYLIEGYYHRTNETEFDGKEFTKFIVDMQDEKHNIVFYKSLRSEKWWMEVPYPSGLTKYSKVSIIPCSYADYETATSGEIPERWVHTHSKLI